MTASGVFAGVRAVRTEPASGPPLDGQPATIEAFCRKEWPRLVAFLAYQTGSRELAEDLAQETLARVHRSWPRVKDLESPSGWAHRVAMNLARSHFRRVRLGRRLRGPLEPPLESAELEPSTAILIRTAVMKLPPRERAAVVLRHCSDLSVAEAATAMGCPENTVKTLTRRGLARLREDPSLVDSEAKESE